MTTIMPNSDRMKKAVQYVSEQRQAEPEKTPKKIVNEATLKFDLTPSECEFLAKFVSGDTGQ